MKNKVQENIYDKIGSKKTFMTKFIKEQKNKVLVKLQNAQLEIFSRRKNSMICTNELLMTPHVTSHPGLPLLLEHATSDRTVVEAGWAVKVEEEPINILNLAYGAC